MQFLNNQGSGGSKFADLPSNGYRSGLLVFYNLNLDRLVFEDVLFEGNVAYYHKDDPSSVVPCLFQIDRDILNLDSKQVEIKNL